PPSLPPVGPGSPCRVGDIAAVRCTTAIPACACDCFPPCGRQFLWQSYLPQALGCYLVRRPRLHRVRRCTEASEEFSLGLHVLEFGSVVSPFAKRDGIDQLMTPDVQQETRLREL